MSGIYIKDVKLPDGKPGAFAAIVLYVGKDGQLRATGTHQMEVIPVPDHGDLIDRDVLMEKRWDADTRCGYVQVIDVGDVVDAPTIIMADKEKNA